MRFSSFFRLTEKLAQLPAAPESSGAQLRLRIFRDSRAFPVTTVRDEDSRAPSPLIVDGRHR
jgi:hypothetical protein